MFICVFADGACSVTERRSYCATGSIRRHIWPGSFPAVALGSLGVVTCLGPGFGFGHIGWYALYVSRCKGAANMPIVIEMAVVFVAFAQNELRTWSSEAAGIALFLPPFCLCLEVALDGSSFTPPELCNNGVMGVANAGAGLPALTAAATFAYPVSFQRWNSLACVGDKLPIWT